MAQPQPFAQPFTFATYRDPRRITERCEHQFQRELRTPDRGARRPATSCPPVPKSEALFPHEVGYEATRKRSVSYRFAPNGFGRPSTSHHVTSTIDTFAASTTSSFAGASAGLQNSPVSGAATSRPAMSNYRNTIGASKWTTAPGNRSFYPFPLGRHEFGVVKR